MHARQGVRDQEGNVLKIVIITDLHGNCEALRCLPEAHDELWVLGDLVNYGPDPAAVVDIVKAKSTVTVRGNHDHSIGYEVDPRCGARYQKMAETTRQYTASVLNKSQKEFLRELPLHVDLQRQNKRFYLCHAKPSDPLYGYCPEDSDDWIREVDSVPADVLLVGIRTLRSYDGLGIVLWSIPVALVSRKPANRRHATRFGRMALLN